MGDKRILQRARRYLLPTERAMGSETHEYMPELCHQLQTGQINRRDFLRHACLLGASVGAAYSMAGILTGQRPISEALAATPKSGGALRVSMRVQEMTDPGNFDWAEKSNVARFIVEHLTRTRADNVTVPYLAKSWEASDDLKTWVFNLNENVTWSNGDKFTSADVAHTVNRWIDPANGSSNLGLFDAMVEKGADGKKRGIANAVEIVDDHTIKFNLKQAALAMPENFYNYPTAITHRGFGTDYKADLSANPIGTGPFKLADFSIGEKAILKKERDWWAGDFYLDEIQYFDHGEDTNAWVAALASQQVDMIYTRAQSDVPMERDPDPPPDFPKKNWTYWKVDRDSYMWKEVEKTLNLGIRFNERQVEGDFNGQERVVIKRDNGELISITLALYAIPNS